MGIGYWKLGIGRVLEVSAFLSTTAQINGFALLSARSLVVLGPTALTSTCTALKRVQSFCLHRRTRTKTVLWMDIGESSPVQHGVWHNRGWFYWSHKWQA